MIDLVSPQSDKSFIKSLIACDFNRILSQSMLIKLNKYLNDNQRFKVDKSNEKELLN